LDTVDDPVVLTYRELMVESDKGDPRARWRVLPDRPAPEEWVTVKDDEPVPGSVRLAEEQRATQEARRLIEWSGGAGA